MNETCTQCINILQILLKIPSTSESRTAVMLSVVKFRYVASRKDKIAYVTYNDSRTNYSKFTWVGFLIMRPKHDYIVKGSVTLCTKDGRTIPLFKATSNEDTQGNQFVASEFLTRDVDELGIKHHASTTLTPRMMLL